MKKTLLSILFIGSLVVAADEAQIKQEIADVQAQIKILNENLKQLQNQLPKPVVKKENSESEFVIHAEFGYILTSGNTDTDSFNLDAKIKKNWGKHVYTYSILKQYGTENDIETKNKLLTELEYDYDFTKRLSFGYLIGYKDDKFSGFNYQLYTGPGIKYKAIKTKAHLLSIEGNILYSIDDKENTTTTIEEKESYISYRAKVVYTWQILKNLKFNQELSYRSEFSNTSNYFIYSKTLLSSKVSDIFSVGISQQADYMNQTIDGKTSTDRTFTFNLIADY